jgi:hypothetical protein
MQVLRFLEFYQKHGEVLKLPYKRLPSLTHVGGLLCNQSICKIHLLSIILLSIILAIRCGIHFFAKVSNLILQLLIPACQLLVMSFKA